MRKRPIASPSHDRPLMVASVSYGHLRPSQQPADVLLVPMQLPAPVCILSLVKTAA